MYPPQLLRLAPPEDVPELSAQRAAGSGAGSGSGSDDSSGLTELSPWITTPAKVLGPPMLIVGAVTAAMAGLKGRRRKRRRTRGAPSDRVAAGWEEICDLAVDFGDVVPSLATRREAAVVLARPGIAPLAQSADALLFGPEPVDDATAERYWQEVAVAREAIRSGQTRFARWKALVNPTSLRRSAGRRRRASASPTPRMPAVPKRVVPGGAA